MGSQRGEGEEKGGGGMGSGEGERGPDNKVELHQLTTVVGYWDSERFREDCSNNLFLCGDTNQPHELCKYSTVLQNYYNMRLVKLLLQMVYNAYAYNIGIGIGQIITLLHRDRSIGKVRHQWS